MLVRRMRALPLNLKMMTNVDDNELAARPCNTDEGPTIPLLSPTSSPNMLAASAMALKAKHRPPDVGPSRILTKCSTIMVASFKQSLSGYFADAAVLFGPIGVGLAAILSNGPV